MSWKYDQLVEEITEDFCKEALAAEPSCSPSLFTYYPHELYVGGEAYRVEVDIATRRADCWLHFTLEGPNHASDKVKISQLWALWEDVSHKVLWWTNPDQGWEPYPER